MRTARYLALSLGLHALVVAVLVPQIARRKDQWTPVKVRLVEARPAPRGGKPAAPKPAAQRPRASSRPAVGAALRPATEPEKVERYEDLLPDASYQFGGGTGAAQGSGAAGAAQGPGGTGRSVIATDLAITSEEISGKLDIPLFFRKRNGRSKAVAKVVRQPDGAFVFEYVDGDPYMRAVLFEGLRTAEGQAQVQRLFVSMRSGEILIVLNLSVVQGNGPTGETFEDFAVDGHKLVISKTTVLGQTSGFFLPDEEAKRAERRDAAHLEQLKTSPAFTSPLRNERP